MSKQNPLIPSPLDELELSDEYIYQLLIQEAEEAKQRANSVGVLGYLSKYKEPTFRTNVPNKRFLKNVVQSTISFNKNENQKKEREKKLTTDKYHDDYHRTRSRRSSSRDRYSRSRSRSPSRNKERRRSSPDKHNEHKRKRDDIDNTPPPNIIGENEFPIGPKLPQITENKFLLKTKPRGRGAIGSDRLDQYFATINEDTNTLSEESYTKIEDNDNSTQQSVKASKKEKKNKKEKKHKKKEKKIKKSIKL